MSEHQLTLYTNPHSRGQIAHWVMEELALPYRTAWIEFGPEGHKSSKFLKINPMGKLPALVHNSQTITECAAICAYAAELDPEGLLKPARDQLAPYYRWLFFAAGPLEQAVTNKALGLEVPEGKEGTIGYGTFDQAVSATESYLKSHDYICGTSFSAADVYVGSHIVWGLLFKTLPDLPAFRLYGERLTSRVAYQKSQKINADKRG